MGWDVSTAWRVKSSLLQVNLKRSPRLLYVKNIGVLLSAERSANWSLREFCLFCEYTTVYCFRVREGSNKCKMADTPPA